MSEPDARILAVDDEHVILEVLSQGLSFAGYEVTTARNGSAALALAAETVPDLIVLDVMLPDMDGFEVCRRLRESNDNVPVVFLTARDEDEDILAGFDQGGDDYLVKPFRLEELVARVKAVLKRTGDKAAGTATPLLRCDDLALDEERHQATVAGEPLDLTPTEFRLLRYLLLNQDRVLSKDQILEAVWGPDHLGDGARVETFVSYLRRKLGERAALVHTIRGVGYTLRAPERA